MKATAVAGSNIAFVKYWGKKDTSLNIPMNPSISMTLDESISAKTTAEFSDKYPFDEFFLDGKKQEGERLRRVSSFLDIARKMAGKKYFAKVSSVSTFPSGTGIASSASGFAALAGACSKALGLNLSSKELSGLARLGSGSACRSIFGGFAEWHGEYPTQIKDEIHWPEIRDIILIVSKEEKKISSRIGMQLTVETSRLYKKRLSLLPARIQKVRKAIIDKDFKALAVEIMEDSDNMHECMLDTHPKLDYLNEKSKRIKEAIKQINGREIKAAYTFDAGPNAHIITLDKHEPDIRKALNSLDYISILVGRPGPGIRYPESHLF